MSWNGLPPGGVSTSSRVHGKFSIHDACAASGSIATIAARVRGAIHQSCQRTWAPGHASAAARPGALPPWALTIRIRLKPWLARESTRSRRSAR